MNDLASQLGVSRESIRRDLRELELSGLARRIYGGAVISPKEGDRPFSERARVNAREKSRIGEAAAAIVKDGMKIFVSSGTTSLAVVRHLNNHKELTIVTNSIAVAAHYFSRSWGTNVRVLGGAMVPEYQATFGHATVTSLAGHYFDLAVLGASAVHPEQGIMGYGEDEAALHSTARSQAATTIIVADGSKFGRFGSVHAFGLADVDTVVTSGRISEEFLLQFAKEKVRLIQA